MTTEIVPSTNIAAMFVTLIVSFSVPAVLWILFARKDKRLSVAVIAGAAGFVLPQMIIRLPILQFLATTDFWLRFLDEQKITGITVYAFSAALFETAGRLLVLKGIMRRRLSFYTALGSGIGHGGAESIGIIGLMYINNIVLSFMINSGNTPAVAGLDTAIKALIETSPRLFLVAGLERALTIPLHMALSVLICYFIMRKKSLAGSIYCLLIHFLVDFIVVLMAANNISIWLIEGLLLLIAAFSVIFMIKIKSKYTTMEVPKDPAEIALDEGY